MTQLETLAAVAAILVGLERALSKGVLGPTLTPKWRAAALALITAAIAVVNGVEAGNSWGTAALAAVATTGTALLCALAEAVTEYVRWRRAEEMPKLKYDFRTIDSARLDAVLSAHRKTDDVPPVPPTAALLLLLALPGLDGCAGTLEASRAEAQLTTVAGVRMGATRAIDPGRCASLSDRQAAWGATAAASGVLSGAAGLTSIPVQNETARTALVGGAVGAAALAAAAELVSTNAATSWVSEGCAP